MVGASSSICATVDRESTLDSGVAGAAVAVAVLSGATVGRLAGNELGLVVGLGLAGPILLVASGMEMVGYAVGVGSEPLLSPQAAVAAVPSVRPNARVARTTGPPGKNKPIFESTVITDLL